MFAFDSQFYITVVNLKISFNTLLNAVTTCLGYIGMAICIASFSPKMTFKQELVYKSWSEHKFQNVTQFFIQSYYTLSPDYIDIFICLNQLINNCLIKIRTSFANAHASIIKISSIGNRTQIVIYQNEDYHKNSEWNMNCHISWNCYIS